MADAGSVCHNRKLFVTRKGYFGLGPEAMEVRDLCCVLFSARVHYILRPVNNGYILVGESYIYRVMRGEVTDTCPIQTVYGDLLPTTPPLR